MKKITSFVVAVLCASAVTFAQESMFNVGDKVASAGLGVGSTIGYSLYGTKIPPIFLRADYGFKDDIGPGVIGIGGIIGMERYGWSTLYDSWSYSRFIIGASGTYHYAFIDKLDTYGGISLGFRVTTQNYKDKYNTAFNYNHIYPGLFSAFFVGARYYLTDKIGLMAEMGYDITWLKFGVSVKL
jgi:hypothetical protein